MRRAYNLHRARCPQLFKHRQMLTPCDEVVDLVDVNATVVPLQRAANLLPSLACGCSPHLVGNQYPIATSSQRSTKDAFGFAVHR